MTAAHTARLDQATATFNDEARLLVAVYKKRMAKGRSAELAAADICALLSTWPPAVVVDICASAVALLATQEDSR